MPSLSWIGKEEVVNHHLQVPFRLLRDVRELGGRRCGHGVALKAILPKRSDREVR